jgi:hypothetical protein
MTLKLSQHDKDFADAMALKLRLNREGKAVAEKEQKLIEETGDFRMSIARDAIKNHPELTIEEVLKGMREMGF